MPDREKVISEFEDLVKSFSKRDETYYKGLFVSVLAMLKEQEAEISKISNAYLDLVGKASKQPQIVRCKDCKKRYKRSCGYFYADGQIMCDDWFCADGERKES